RGQTRAQAVERVPAQIYHARLVELGDGYSGRVYPVYRETRLSDAKAVAVKAVTIREHEHEYCQWPRLLRGQSVPTEIAMLDRVAGFDGVVRMLDYYKTSDRWLIVMERPRRVYAEQTKGAVSSYILIPCVRVFCVIYVKRLQSIHFLLFV
uniref:non-specific serine/threonine protein kinase n=1 Tax=Monopterus albus TaxID=43700 RepID=A0A3Q3JT74_MONAL